MSKYSFSQGEMPEGEALARINRGIAQTMSAIVAERYNPHTVLPRAQPVTVANAPRVTTAFGPEPSRSERDTIDLRRPPSYADRVVGAMIDAAHPPAPPTMASIRASVAAIPSAMRKEMLLRPQLRPELREMLMEAEAQPR